MLLLLIVPLALGCAGLICIVVGILGATGGGRPGDVDRLLRVPPVPGRVIADVRRRNWTPDSAIVTYSVVQEVEFVPPGGRGPVRGHPVLREAFAGDATGMQVAVHCDPRDPRRFVAVRTPGRFDRRDVRGASGMGWAAVVVGVVLLALSAVLGVVVLLLPG